MSRGDALQRILRTLSDRAGLSFSPGRREEVEKAALSLAPADGPESLQSIAAKLETGELDVLPLVDQLTVGETYFFRHPEQFEFLRGTVLPSLTTSMNGERLRFWSAGCASGEEAYSLAILLQEEGLAGRSEIIATDISRRALERARAASYNAWSFRGCEASFISRHFEHTAGRYLLTAPVRRAVTFRELNFATGPGKWQMAAPRDVHVIFMRNVLIYFDEATVRLVAQRLFESLTPGGWLIAAASDPLLARYAPFETEVHEAGVFCRRPLTEAPFAAEPLSSAVLSELPPQGGEIGSMSVSSPPPRVVEHELSPDQGSNLTPSSSASDVVDDAEAEILLLRAAIGTTPPEKLRDVAAAMVERHPRVVELQFMNAVILMNQERDAEAMEAFRRVIYLQRELALAHVLLAVLLRRNGRESETSLALRNAARICDDRPADEPVPLGDGEVYGSLRSTIAAYAEMLGSVRVGGANESIR